MKMNVEVILTGFVVLTMLVGDAFSSGADDGARKLDEKAASSFAKIALGCVHREYPNKPGHVMNDADEVRPPHELHPAFYGCFDWHSAVHGHWMLVRLLKLFPDLPERPEIREALGQNLSAENILGEVAYFDEPNRKSFERTYGWAWLLKLAEELHEWDDPDGRTWSANLRPLADAIVNRYINFLPKQTYPIRTGVHPNTAFGIAFAWDYATAVGHSELRGVLEDRSRTYYGKDTDYPGAWEPGGEDFFSPSLMEADLMRRVVEPDKFSVWLNAFLPELEKGKPQSILQPATVTDRTDPKIVHLDGLNLSRAWCMVGVASVLAEDDPKREVLLTSAALHANDALNHVASGNYEGEHWLASFAVYLMSNMGK